jgi:hypothetical protein
VLAALLDVSKRVTLPIYQSPETCQDVVDGLALLILYTLAFSRHLYADYPIECAVVNRGNVIGIRRSVIVRVTVVVRIRGIRGRHNFQSYTLLINYF